VIVAAFELTCVRQRQLQQRDESEAVASGNRCYADWCVLGRWIVLGFVEFDVTGYQWRRRRRLCGRV